MSVNFIDSEGKIISSSLIVSNTDIVGTAEYEYAEVLNGGKISSVNIQNGGMLVVSSGGAAEHVTVKEGGNISLAGNASASDITVEVGGKIGGFSFNEEKHWSNAPGGQVAVGSKIVIAENEMKVYYGAIESGITAENATVTLDEGAVLSDITLNDGGNFLVGGEVDNTVVNANGFAFVAGAGRADVLTVNAKGGAVVLSNATDVTVKAGAYFDGFVFQSDYEIADISNGSGNFKGHDVEISYNADGGSLEIKEGAAINGIIAYDGNISVAGVAGNVEFYAFDYILNVASTGVVNGVVNYGTMDVVSGGSAYFVENNGIFAFAGYAENVRNAGLMITDENAVVMSGLHNADGAIIDFAGKADKIYNSGTVTASSTVQADEIYNYAGAELEFAGSVNLIDNAGSAVVKGNAVVSALVNSDGGYVDFAGKAVNVDNAGEIKFVSGASVTSLANTAEADLVSGTFAQVSNSGNLFVYAGAEITSSVVNSGNMRHAGSAAEVINSGDLFVYSTGKITDLVNEENGNVDFNGIAQNITNAGTMIISGGAADKLSAETLVNAGTLDLRANVGDLINSGSAVVGSAVQISSLVNEDGSLTLKEGVAVESVTVNGGIVSVSSGNVLSNNTVNGGLLYVSSGVALKGETNVNGGSIFIAFDTEVDELNVKQGADFNGFIFTEDLSFSGKNIENGIFHINKNINVTDDRLTVTEKDKLDGIKVTSGHFYLENASASNTEVNNVMRVMSDSVASNTIVNSNGNMYIENSIAENTTVNSGGVLAAGAGAVVNSSYINKGAKMYADNGAVVNSANIDGVFDLNGGATASGIVVSKDGILNLTVTKGTNAQGKMYIKDGTTQSFSMVDGLIKNYTVLDSSVMNITDGAASNTTIKAGGAVYVNDKGIASDTVVNSSAFMYVTEGGIAENTAVKGGALIVSAAGAVSSAMVSSGGSVLIEKDGNAVENNISAGGQMTVEGKASNTTVMKDGSLTVEDGGYVEEIHVNSGGSFVVKEGGIASSSYIKNSAGMELFGTAYNTDIGTDGTMNIHAGAVAFNNIAYLKADLNVAGYAYNNEIRGSAVLNVTSGGIAEKSLITSGGSMLINEGAYASDITVNKYADLQISTGGAASNLTLNGTADVAKEAVLKGVTVNFGAQLDVAGEASDAIIESNGRIDVASSGKIYNAEVKAGATLNIADGGAAENVHVYSTGVFNFGVNSTVTGTVIYRDATVTVDGVISNTKVKGKGNLYINSSATHKGTLTIEERGNVYINGTLDFTLTDVVHTDTEYQVNNLDRVKGVPTYTITINEGQYGIYELAQFADCILGETITVNVIGENNVVSNFTVTANGEGYLHSNGSRYELVLNDSNDLILNVAMPAPIFSPSTMEPTKDDVVLTVVFPENSDNLKKYYRVKGKTEWNEYIEPIIVTDNTTYEFYAQDGDYTSFISEYEVKNIDRSKPEVAVTGNFEDFGKKELQLYINVTDQSPYTIEYSFNGGVTWGTLDGNIINAGIDKTYINLRVTDKAGNVTEYTEKFTENNNTPEISNITYNGAMTKEDVSIQVNVSNNCEALYSFDKLVWYEYDKITGIVVSENKDVYVKAIDEWGNQSVKIETVSITNIDKVAPVVTGTLSTTEPTNKSVTLTVEISDDVQPASVQYSLDGGNSWVDSAVAPQIHIGIEQNTLAIVKVRDTAGNETLFKQEITNIDREKPIAPVITDAVTDFTNEGFVIEVDYSPYAAEKLYSVDNGLNWVEYTDGIAVDENCVIMVKSIDTAGNESDIVSYEVTNIDKVDPEITTSLSTDAETVEPVIITVFAKDDVEVAEVEYTTDDGISWNNVVNNKISVAENCTVTIRVTDVAGNSVEKVHLINNIVAPEIEKYDVYNSKVFIGSTTDISQFASMSAFKVIPVVKNNASSQSVKTTANAKGTLDINGKDTEDIDFFNYAQVNVKNGADTDTVNGGKYSYSSTVKTTVKNNNTTVNSTLAETSAVTGKLNVTGKAFVAAAENYGTAVIDNASVGELAVNAVKVSESETKINDIRQSYSRTETKSAAGTVTLKNGASADNISNYKTVKLTDSSVSGDISLEAYTRKDTAKDGNSSFVTTYTRTGSLTAVGSTVGNIINYNTVKLTDSTVGNIINSNIAKNDNGLKIGKLAGTVTLTDSKVTGAVEKYTKLTMSGSSVADVNKVRNVVISKGINNIGTFVGTAENDTLTINKNAVLVISSADFGDGAKDKLVLNGTLVLEKAFNINAENITGKGEIVAAHNVWQNLANRKQVTDLGNTVENFVSSTVELADNTEKKAAKWDLESDYKGWLSNGVAVHDTVDFVKFKNKNGGTLEITGFGAADIVTLNGKELTRNDEGNFVVEFAANTNNILKLERNEENSMSYSISLIS